jgi:hypothetical protein
MKAKGVLMNSPPLRILPNGPDVLGLVRELYSRRPEARCLEPYELQSLLYSLNYTDELLDEGEIAAAIEVARTDFDPDQGAA